MAVVRPLLRLSLRLHLRKFEKDSSHELIEVVVKEISKAELAKWIVVVVAVIVILNMVSGTGLSCLMTDSRIQFGGRSCEGIGWITLIPFTVGFVREHSRTTMTTRANVCHQK